MNSNTSDRDDVEDLVRGFLVNQERDVDAERILAGVRSKMSVAGTGESPPTARLRLRAGARWVAVAAAAVLVVGFAWTFRQSTARADAIQLVLDARKALGTSPNDRAYQIRIELAPGMAERAPFLAAIASHNSRLWTRSDRFWIEGRKGSRVWAVGRDVERHIWVAPSADVGLNFASDDVPEPLDEALDLFTFELDTVLHMLSTDFDVKRLSDADSTITRIQGTPRAGHPRPRLRSITVEIDERTKIVRQVVLSRLRDGRPAADVSFTFDGAETQSDASYQLTGHLNPDASIRGADQRLRRRRELVRFFGSLLIESE